MDAYVAYPVLLHAKRISVEMKDNVVKYFSIPVSVKQKKKKKTTKDNFQKTKLPIRTQTQFITNQYF